MRQSSRPTRQAEFYDPSQAAAGAAGSKPLCRLDSLVGPAERAAVKAACAGMVELSKDAAAAEVPDPAAGPWKAWGQAAKAVGEGGKGGDETAAALRSELQTLLMEAEAALFAAAVATPTDDEDEEEEEEESGAGEGPSGSNSSSDEEDRGGISRSAVSFMCLFSYKYDLCYRPLRLLVLQ
jgi:hypothetical protein